ncbi:MAG: hypothetical protein WC721_19585 [Victivallaceae bacterium]
MESGESVNAERMSGMSIWYMLNDTPKCRSVGSEKSGKREK